MVDLRPILALNMASNAIFGARTRVYSLHTGTYSRISPVIMMMENRKEKTQNIGSPLAALYEMPGIHRNYSIPGLL